MPIVGRPPDAEDTFWLSVASKMTPDESIERLDTHGKYLFSTVSIVGTLLTGFGIFSPLGATALRNPWLFLPVALACLSLALAMMGITPRLGEVNRCDIYSIRKHYNDLIRRRGRFIFWAGVAFALSLLSVAVVLVFSLRPTPVTPAISVRLIGTGDKMMLTGKIEFQELPRTGVAETEILGFKDTKKEPKQTLLFKEISRADQAGKVSVSAELDQVTPYKRFVVQTKVRSGTKVLYEEKVEVTR